MSKHRQATLWLFTKTGNGRSAQLSYLKLLFSFTNRISLDDFGLVVLGYIDKGLTTNRNISEVCAKACALNSGSVLSVQPEMPVMTCIEHMQFYIRWGLQGCKRFTPLQSLHVHIALFNTLVCNKDVFCMFPLPAASCPRCMSTTALLPMRTVR